MKFHTVFDELNVKSYENDIFSLIKTEILIPFERFDFKFDDESTKALIKFASSDRKKFGIVKVLPRFKAQKTLITLISSGFLKVEKNKEIKIIPANKNEKLPRNLRRRTIHDKVHFRSNFARFWFRFCQPNLELLKAGRFDKVLEIIKDDFDNYASLGFELLSAELLRKALNLRGYEISSFWNKDEEIDIFAVNSSDLIVGEVKYKDRKVCKNTLTLLEQKCHKLGFNPNLYTIFSKNGFSNKLLSTKRDDLMLFEMKDFKILLE
ncbi:MAG: DUF234 domain-containing protein [Campylobacter sp.]|nr:DUF234 domain-containing protein [Campylobacter sp.]